MALVDVATDAERSALAQRLCVEAADAFWAGLQDRLGTAVPVPAPPSGCRRGSLAAEATAAAQSFGAALASLPLAEAAHQLGSAYAAMVPPGQRARDGVHYTPPAFAARVLDQAEAAGLDWRTARVLDPACGAGAFLVPAAIRMIASLAGADPAITLQSLAGRLQGWEIDPTAAWLAQFLVEAVAIPLTQATGRRLNPLVAVRDSLAADEADAFDLVVGNPPFGRVSLPAPLRARYGRGLYGHANLYGIFMDLAVRLAKPGGLIAFLTPASFLAGEYFKNLRSVFWSDAPPVNIDFVEMRKGVFDGVLQETVLGIYRRGAHQAAIATVHFLRRGHGGEPRPEAAGRFRLPSEPTDPWLVPRRSEDAKLAARLRGMRCRIADWGYCVSTGPLVWNRHKAQLHDEPGRGRVPLVWAESVGSDGRFAFRCQRRNHKPYFEIRPSDGWLVVRTPCVLLQRTTAKEQARRLIAAEMPAAFVAAQGGVTVENHLNMLLPAVAAPPVAPAVLAAFLNTEAADRTFRCLSGSVAVSAYEIEAMPLPTPSALTAFSRLVARGVDRAALEAEAARLYGMGGGA